MASILTLARNQLRSPTRQVGKVPEQSPEERLEFLFISIPINNFIPVFVNSSALLTVMVGAILLTVLFDRFLLTLLVDGTLLTALVGVSGTHLIKVLQLRRDSIV